MAKARNSVGSHECCDQSQLTSHWVHPSDGDAAASDRCDPLLSRFYNSSHLVENTTKNVWHLLYDIGLCVF